MGGPVGVAQAFDDAIDGVRIQQPAFELRQTQPGQQALEALFAPAPDALFAQRQRQRLALREFVFHAPQRPDVFGQRPMHQHGGAAVGLQAVEQALHAQRLGIEHRLGELEGVVARHVEHGALDLLKTELARRVEQREFLQLLVRRQQVALDPVGQKTQAQLAGLAAGHVLPLQAQPLRDPGRQLGALDRVDAQCQAVLLERGKPGAFEGGGVQPGQQHQGEQIGVMGGGGGQLLQHRRALLAGFARRDAQLQQLAFGKQALAAAGGQHCAPVEVRAADRAHAALRKALRPRGGADGVGRLLHQQRFVAVHGVEGFEAALQVRGQLGGGALHGRAAV